MLLSCSHGVHDRVAFQISRLEHLGFLRQVPGPVLRRLRIERKSLRKGVLERPEGRPVVVPYARKMLHHLKTLARRYAPVYQVYL